MELVFRASEMCIAPSAPTLLSHKLPARDENRRQGLLTVGRTMYGGVPEGLEGGVGLQCLRDVLGALRTDVVVFQAAKESRMDVLGGC